MLDRNDIKTATSFLQRLRSNNTGNVFAMAAAAIFPIAAVVGGGVDIGRAYMAKARLQQACDAGALAARRNMTGDTLSTADITEARRYFDFNFPDGTFGTDPFTSTPGGAANPRFYDGPGDKTVIGHAETTIDTSIMQLFGYSEMTFAVDCTSRLDIGNVDVMMVLDVTGSMSSSNYSGGVYQTRLQGLKNSVKNFYNILGPGGGTSGSQIRYGFMPYNLVVNVGKTLYNENPDWLVGGTGDATEDEWTYQTRRPIWLLPSNDPIVSYEAINVAYAYGNDRNACIYNFGRNNAVQPLWTPSNSGYPSGNNITHNGDYYEFSYYSYRRYSRNFKYCVRKVEKWVGGKSGGGTSAVWQPGATFDHWEYDEFKHDVSGYVASIDTSNPAVLVPTLYDNPSNDTHGATVRWNGCIEERDTFADITSTTNAIPDDAYDLKIDLLPSNKATRWRPFWGEVIYNRNSSTSGWKSGYSACPVEGRRLAEYDSYDASGTDSNGTTVAGSLETYINSLVANGGTNHTIGMIWGARYLAEEGLFATENQSTDNGFNISRHLVFMTDGQLTQYPDYYEAYGLHQKDGRIAPTNSNWVELANRQKQRFKLICNEMKRQGTTIWIIQFTGSSSPDADLLACGTSASHVTVASNNAALDDAFSNIAKTIGGLRLSE